MLSLIMLILSLITHSPIPHLSPTLTLTLPPPPPPPLSLSLSLYHIQTHKCSFSHTPSPPPPPLFFPLSLPSDSLQPLLNDDFEAKSFATRTIQAQMVGETLSKLAEGISLLDKELYTQVVGNYEDLLSQANGIEALESETTYWCTSNNRSL